MSDEENGRETSVEGLTTMARENRETKLYVVRDLSWELARYLDAESIPASAPATPNSVSA